MVDINQLRKPVKKLQKLIKKMDSQPTPEAVHDLRTNARRFETTVKALSLDKQDVAGSTLKILGRLRKRAGKVRDMDVLTTHASEVQPDGEKDCAVVLLEHLGAQRRKHVKKLHVEIQRHRPAMLRALKRAPAVLAKRVKDKGNAGSGSKVVANATATAVKLATRLAVPQRLDRKTLHPYRLQVKELRSVLQLAAGADGDKFVDDLGKLKDAIGDWHDWEELILIAEKVLDHGNGCGLLTELRERARSKYEQALALAETLRKTYLRSFHPAKKGASTASPKIPSEPVWNAIALLAA